MPLPKQSVFDSKTVSWEGFIRSFNNLAESYQWNNEQKTFRLLHSLRGEAASFVFEQLDSGTLNALEPLVEALQARFGETLSSNAFLAQLEVRKLGAKESLAEYTADMWRLTLKGYPTADNNTRDTIALRYFIRGLCDHNMILRVGMRDPKSLDEARAATETFISLRDDSGTKGKFVIRSMQEIDPAKDFVTKETFENFSVSSEMLKV